MRNGKRIFRNIVLTGMMLAAMPVWSSAQDTEWFCPSCGKADNGGKFCPACGHGKPVDGILFFDDMQSSDPAEKWCTIPLKNVEASGLGVDGSFKTEYSGQPVPLYETRQGSKVIGSTAAKSKTTITRISWDAFHEHSHEITDIDENTEYGTMQPAIDGHAIFLPERFTVEFDMYLFTPASGSRKNDNEDWCSVTFCGHTFCINTWGSDFYNMFFEGGGSPAVKVTKPGWRHFEIQFDEGSASLLLDGEHIASCSRPPHGRYDGDNHLGFGSGSNPKFFCIKNVKVVSR